MNGLDGADGLTSIKALDQNVGVQGTNSSVAAKRMLNNEQLRRKEENDKMINQVEEYYEKKDEKGNFVHPIFSKSTEDSFASQILGVFF